MVHTADAHGFYSIPEHPIFLHSLLAASMAFAHQELFWKMKVPFFWARSFYMLYYFYSRWSMYSRGGLAHEDVQCARFPISCKYLSMSPMGKIFSD